METKTIDQMILDLQSIKRARGLTGDEKVIACSNYGDRHRTLQVITLGEFETVTLSETSYSESGYCIDEDLDGDKEEYLLLNYELVY